MARGKKTEKILTQEEKLQQALVPENEQPYKVPENWCWTKVGVLSSLHRGVSYKKSDAHVDKKENDCLVMRGGNIGEGYIDIDSDNVYVDLRLVNEDQLVKKNDIIIVASTGSTKVIGRAGISFADYTDVAFGAFLMVVRPNEKPAPRYMDFFFQSDLYRNRIRDLASGVNINNIRADYITETPYPLPPLPEQKRIVDRIESLFAKLDEAKEKAQTVVDGFEDRKAAILHKAFTGELTAEWRKHHDRQEKGWIQSILKDCSSAIGDGLHGTPVYDDNGEYWFINGNNLSGSQIEIKADTKKVNEKEYKKYWIELIPKTTVLLSINGTLGKTAFYNGEPIILGKSACYINTKECLDKYFLRYYFMSKEFIDYANSMATGSTIKNLGLKAIRNMPINLPHIDEQVEIVRLLDNILVAEEQVKESAEQVITQIDTMKKSILARAFRGELGTYDSSDESAEELLKRIL